MHCEQAESLMFDYVEDRLSQDMRMRIGDHLEGCPGCRALHSGIVDLRAQAAVWHDVAPPAWQLPRVPSRFDLSGFGQWFANIASAAALILVVILYLQQPAGYGAESLAQQRPETAAGQTPAGQIPAGQPAALPATHLSEASRAQRQEELRALARILKAEMDRRSLETEESLRYVIAHQIQGQRELDDLARRIRQIAYSPPGVDTRQLPADTTREPPGERM